MIKVYKIVIKEFTTVEDIEPSDYIQKDFLRVEDTKDRSEPEIIEALEKWLKVKIEKYEIKEW